MKIHLDEVATKLNIFYAERVSKGYPCQLCGKGVPNETYFVHLLTTGEITTEDEDAHSQGLQVIGSGCARKLKRIDKNLVKGDHYDRGRERERAGPQRGELYRLRKVHRV